MKFSVWGSLVKKLLAQHRMFGPDHALDGVEHARVAYQLVEEGEQQMRLVAQAFLDLTALRLERLEPAAILARGLRRERAEREQVAVLVVSGGSGLR